MYDHPCWHFTAGTGGSHLPLWPFGFFGGGFGLGAGGLCFGAKHPPGLEVCLGLHMQGLCFPFSLGGFPAIISINKIRMTIFRIMSTNYVWISKLNVRYQKYQTSKKTYFKELFEVVCRTPQWKFLFRYQPEIRHIFFSFSVDSYWLSKCIR